MDKGTLLALIGAICIIGAPIALLGFMVLARALLRCYCRIVEQMAADATEHRRAMMRARQSGHSAY